MIQAYDLGRFLFNGPFALSILILILALVLAKQWPANSRLHWPLLALAILVHVRYILWRAHTLNHADVYTYTASVTLYTAEVYGFVTVLLFYLQTFWPRHREPCPRPAAFAPSVDIFVCIVNEPVSVLERTLSALNVMDYPTEKLRVYILDDGKRPGIAALAAEFGADYIARGEHAHAKAGNINSALPLTNGELIAFFDCDHIPVRSFLQETVGYFQDSEVAIVQTPHNFYSSDAFQHNLFMERHLNNEQDMFYHTMMPGRDRFNSAFFSGTSGLIRRQALEEAGGFQVWSVIEDLYTSMELHARGWRSVYHEKILTGALSPESFRDLLRQHQRWARGGVQVFINDNPLFKPGLSLMQRLLYAGSLLYFFHGLTRVIYLLAPLPYLYFNKSPIAAPTSMLLGYFLPYYVANQAAFGLITRRFRNPFWSDAYETADCFALAGTAVATLLNPAKLFFSVTPKGPGGVGERTRWSYLLPHVAVFALLAGGLAVAVMRLTNDKFTGAGTYLSIFWASYNLLLLGIAIGSGREAPRVRKNSRLRRRLRCWFSFDGTKCRGWTHDISEGGESAYLSTSKVLSPEGTIVLRCHCKQLVELKARVVWQKAWGEAGREAGFAFDALDDARRRQLTRLMFACTHSWTSVHYPIHKFRASLNQMLSAFDRAFERADPVRERLDGQWRRAAPDVQDRQAPPTGGREGHWRRPAPAPPKKAPPASHAPPRDPLGAWSVYFAGKIYLYFSGHIPLDIALNLIFFVSLLATSSPSWPRPLRWARNLAAWLAAGALLWHDSWLPSPAFVADFVKTGGMAQMPQMTYVLTFLAPLLRSREALALAAGAAALGWFGRRVHLTWPIAAALFFAGVHHSYHPASAGLDGERSGFYKEEAGRRVAFIAGPAKPDVILIEICSLAQDDLAAAGLADDPFWSQFDVMFTSFNTVTAYSNPASLRLLRANCGQVTHGALYATDAGCSLLHALRGVGYHTYAAYDHDATYQDYSEQVKRYGLADEALPVAGIPVHRRNFDGSNLYDDKTVLSRWWDRRQADGGGPAALFANLMTLHTGGHRINDPSWWKMSRPARYRQAFAELTPAITGLMSRVAASKRPAVLVFIPEHGAALRGSSIQIEDLREMPLPYITVAPIGIKLIGFPGAARRQLIISKPISYLGFATVLSNLVKTPPPFSPEVLSRLTGNLPETPFVAENENDVVLESGGKYYLKAGKEPWTLLPPDTLAGRKLP